jgi:magnesium-transporting ATPase (P-type)
LGIAVGSDSATAIEAADMVLLDSFAAMVEAVEYGRVAYGKQDTKTFDVVVSSNVSLDNLKKRSTLYYRQATPPNSGL